MDEKHPEIIIIKRHADHEEEHHGGAWKIAFADFMTAMMAFFLVLWIINATDKNTKTIIARYFNPLKLEDLAKSKKGIRPATGEDSQEDSNPGAPPSATDGSENDKKEPTAKGFGRKVTDPANPADPQAHFTEKALFSDPYASLDKIAGKAASEPPASVTTAPGGEAEPKINDGPEAAAAAKTNGETTIDTPPKTGPVVLNAFVDPFKSQAAGALANPKPEPPPTAAVQLPPETKASEPPPAPPPAGAPQAEHASPPPAAEPQAEHPAPTPSPETTKLQGDLAKALRAETHAQPAPGIEVKETPEGTLISLTDEYNFGMFAIGSAEPQPKVVRIMEKIAEVLKSHPGAIVVRGHTDARPYRSPTYDNWRLSSARAQMAYYMLIRGGLDEKRIERIEGYAERHLKTPANPLAAENRRIEILLRKDKP